MRPKPTLREPSASHQPDAALDQPAGDRGCGLAILRLAVDSCLFSANPSFALGGHFFEKMNPLVKYPITILTSMMWSFENWFGLRQVWTYLRIKQRALN